jgi:hypothetical protein
MGVRQAFNSPARILQLCGLALNAARSSKINSIRVGSAPVRRSKAVREKAAFIISEGSSWPDFYLMWL